MIVGRVVTDLRGSQDRQFCVETTTCRHDATPLGMIKYALRDF